MSVSYKWRIIVKNIEVAKQIFELSLDNDLYPSFHKSFTDEYPLRRMVYVFTYDWKEEYEIKPVIDYLAALDDPYILQKINECVEIEPSTKAFNGADDWNSATCEYHFTGFEPATY